MDTDRDRPLVLIVEDDSDLRRILLPENWGSHPLRKDYPLEGRGERVYTKPKRKEIGE